MFSNFHNLFYNRDFANNVFEVRICFPLCYMSEISVFNVKSTSS